MVCAPRHILEIGYAAFFKRIMPERTTFVAVDAPPEEWALATAVLGRDPLEPILASSQFGVIILRINHHPGPLLLQAMRHVLPRPTRMPVLYQALTPPPPPLVVLDFEDEAFVHSSLLPVLQAATHVFKRELPADRWRLLRPAPDWAIDEAAYRSNSALDGLLEKIRPLSLGLPLDERRFLPPAKPIEKTVDVFFAGRIDASAWPRRQGRQELLALSERGFVIDMPVEPLPPPEFYRRCAAAALTWSPQGYGWDCFRHYEAAACRSVPVINYPSIERHQGLVEGRHAVFYDPAAGGLTDAISKALADRPRLTRMAEDARQHVLMHHTPEAIADRILTEVFPKL